MLGIGEISGLYHIYKNVEQVLANELFTAAKALDFRKPLKPGKGVDIAHNFVRTETPHATEDHYFKDDISKAVDLISDQSLIEQIENELNALQYPQLKNLFVVLSNVCYSNRLPGLQQGTQFIKIKYFCLWIS